MGKRGVLSLAILLQVITAHAETGALSLIAPALFGVTERQVNDDYAKKLDIDPRVTAPLTLKKDGICTGTFLSDILVLTAGHCVDENSATGDVNIDGVESIGFYLSKYWNGKDETESFDSAIVVFPAGTGSLRGIKKYPRIAETGIAPGETVYFVAYGLENPYTLLLGRGEGGEGVKGWGSSIAESTELGLVKTEVVHLTAKPEENKPMGFSALLPGDSGSAVFNQRGEVVGVAAAIAVAKETELVGIIPGLLSIKKTKAWNITSMFVDIASTQTSLLLENALGHASDPSFELSPSILSSHVSAPEKPFDHVRLVSGVYKARKGDERIFVRPVYRDKKIIRVQATRLENSASKSETYVCKEATICTNRDESWVLGFRKNEVGILQVDMARGNKFQFFRYEE